MAITVEEAADSPELTVGGNGPSATRRYIVRGTTSETTALEQVKSTSPEYYENLVRESRTVRPFGNPLYSSAFEVEVRYVVEDDSQPNDVTETASTKRQNSVMTTNESSFSFETGGGNQHITQAREHIGTFPATEPDHGGAINFDGEAINGIDIQVPVYNFSETHVLPSSVVTSAYKSALFEATGKVCAGEFREYEDGEVLFLGASGNRRGIDEDDDWEITFQFAASRNRESPSIGEITLTGTIQGWYYVWVEYEDAEELNFIVKRPRAVHVERVYDSVQFSTLGIGIGEL